MVFPMAQNKVRSWLVHLYTALGLVCSLYAMIGVFEGNARTMFAWLGVALVIDSTDGMLARRFKVWEAVPRFDGRKLDDITDYIAYVLIPIFACYKFGLVGWSTVPVLCIVLVAAAYGFCMDHAKTDDGYFTGFPNYWNVLVLYLFMFRLPEWINALILFGFAVAVFVPIKYLYPSKTPILRPLNLLITGTWILVALYLVINFESPNRTVLWLSLFGPIYYLGLSLMLYLTGHHRRAEDART